MTVNPLIPLGSTPLWRLLKNRDEPKRPTEKWSKIPAAVQLPLVATGKLMMLLFASRLHCELLLSVINKNIKSTFVCGLLL